MQGLWVRSLLRDLRSHMPCGKAKSFLEEEEMLKGEEQTPGLFPAASYKDVFSLQEFCHIKIP